MQSLTRARTSNIFPARFAIFIRRASTGNGELYDKILIANRGEIACRIIRTARRLGMRTVAVYGDADAGAQHVAMADEAIRLGPSPPKESYLLIDRVIAAALSSGAHAIHPGYGFLSENPALARACLANGLIWVGPPADAIDSMGNKAAAKEVMIKAGVPVTPAYFGEDQSPERFALESRRIGFPVMLKAVKGGGGKGMRIVRTEAELPALLESCQREAATSFGSSAVLVEKYILRPRHIEFQVFADSNGNAVHLWERDCSVQRRHQKVLEEAPAPSMSSSLRDAMGSAAVAAAKTVGYTGAGTVEFMLEAKEGVHASATLDTDNSTHYFMEMNTRLQVEHPVTEMITGLDLVEWQLRVSAGQKLPIADQTTISNRVRGHAVEARVYAENPYRDFLPATGTLKHLRAPAGLSVSGAAAGAGALPLPPALASSLSIIRVDTGVRQGDSVSVFYDPMVSKMICWGATRADAVRGLRDAVGRYQLAGMPSNLPFLHAVLGHPGFVAGGIDTSFLGAHLQECLPRAGAAPSEAVTLAAIAHAGAMGAIPVLDAPQRRQAGGVGAGPWSKAVGARPGLPSSAGIRLAFEDAAIPTSSRAAGSANAEKSTAAASATLQMVPLPGGSVGYHIGVGQGASLRVFIASRVNVVYASSAAASAATVPGFEVATRGKTVTGCDAYEVSACLSPVLASGESVDDPAEGTAFTLHGTVVIIRDGKGGSESSVYLSSLPVALIRKAEVGVHESDLPSYRLLLPTLPFGKAGAAAGTGATSVLAPMPGKLIKLLVSPGQAVTPGQAVAVLEAMKMEHVLKAPGVAAMPGTTDAAAAPVYSVSKLGYALGEFVEDGKEVVGLVPIVKVAK